LLVFFYSLAERGAYFVGPESGFLACGDEDIGRMSDPSNIVERTLELLSISNKLHDKKIIITAGPTKEKIDPVRYITNHSTGKMGYAIAKTALDAGADVTLVTGPTNITPPTGANVVNITSTNDMREAVLTRFADCDAVIAAAAPGDFRPKSQNNQKIKKNSELTLELVSNPDIALELGEKKQHQKIIIFAAESENLLDNAKGKLTRKNADLIVANDITQKGAGFAGDTNIASIIDRQGNIKNYSKMQKSELAQIIVEELTILLENN
jgi:phosphopantothenoylcysteine decarboxylase/phosphopantothenate--cysteine ligase